ncbi:hypothetical protein BDA96_10G157400 [Sorghum bicolor]|nr:hypothetical protein BDA96_10G157400 [Sorghum bicolor]
MQQTPRDRCSGPLSRRPAVQPPHPSRSRSISSPVVRVSFGPRSSPVPGHRRRSPASCAPDLRLGVLLLTPFLGMCP